MCLFNKECVVLCVNQSMYINQRITSEFDSLLARRIGTKIRVDRKKMLLIYENCDVHRRLCDKKSEAFIEIGIMGKSKVP